MTEPTARPAPTTVGESASALLSVEDLRTQFVTRSGLVRAVDGVSLHVDRGEIVGLVGESGSGKSVSSLSVMGLLPKPEGRVVGGRILFEGRNLLDLKPKEMRRIRGNRIAMIFQDPMSSLNPFLKVEEQLVEVATLHLGLNRRKARERAVALLDRVGIPDAAHRIDAYPYQFSGGMRQRVMIAMALLCDPDLLIADEPTTALDVTIQAQILDLLAELRKERGMAMILITHDLGVVAGTCDRVLVMYGGRIVEEARIDELFSDPAHPYTAALLKSVPRLGEAAHSRLANIAGLPPRLDQGPFTGCSFAPRCPLVRDACWDGEPELVKWSPDRYRRCIAPVEEVR